jgi:hypothetical protein
VSGKVEITREAFDQGGNPQMSGLIWRQMTRGYYEALEAYASPSWSPRPRRSRTSPSPPRRRTARSTRR